MIYNNYIPYFILVKLFSLFYFPLFIQSLIPCSSGPRFMISRCYCSYLEWANFTHIALVHPAVLMGLHGISYSWRSDYCGAHMKTYCSSICGYPGIACVKGHLPLLLYHAGYDFQLKFYDSVPIHNITYMKFT